MSGGTLLIRGDSGSNAGSGMSGGTVIIIGSSEQPRDWDDWRTDNHLQGLRVAFLKGSCPIGVPKNMSKEALDLMSSLGLISLMDLLS